MNSCILNAESCIRRCPRNNTIQPDSVLVVPNSGLPTASKSCFDASAKGGFQRFQEQGRAEVMERRLNEDVNVLRHENIGDQPARLRLSAGSCRRSSFVRSGIRRRYEKVGSRQSPGS